MRPEVSERREPDRAGDIVVRSAEVGGRSPVDLRCIAGRIVEIGAKLKLEPGTLVLDAAGGAVLPGLHDHHIHLLALAGVVGSVDCGPPRIRRYDELARALRGRLGSDWLRGVGYHESVAGELDRWQLDAIVKHRPLRIQHRSGALWMLNSAAIERLGLDAGTDAPGVERDPQGRSTGRLFRLDAWLRERTGTSGAVELVPAVSRRLASYGVTGITDATADNDASTASLFERAIEQGDLVQTVFLMGRRELTLSAGSAAHPSAVKVILDEPRLPGFDELTRQIAAAHEANRPVAVHCVTRTELVFAVEAFRAAGVRSGDRIEHASVAPAEVVASLRELGLIVVTQPGFIRERGDSYLVDVEANDLPWLYRCRGFLDANVALAAGTDAPFGDPDPWLAMRTAIDRRTLAGATVGPAESLSPEQALALFTSAPELPGVRQRQLAVGAAGDLCVLARPWRTAREEMTSALVQATIRRGRIVWRRP
jgi:predicted amidohydrolase YtcJ